MTVNRSEQRISIEDMLVFELEFRFGRLLVDG